MTAAHRLTVHHPQGVRARGSGNPSPPDCTSCRATCWSASSSPAPMASRPRTSFRQGGLHHVVSVLSAHTKHGQEVVHRTPSASPTWTGITLPIPSGSLESPIAGFEGRLRRASAAARRLPSSESIELREPRSVDRRWRLRHNCLDPAVRVRRGHTRRQGAASLSRLDRGRAPHRTTPAWTRPDPTGYACPRARRAPSNPVTAFAQSV
jgi:hypothetical protein